MIFSRIGIMQSYKQQDEQHAVSVPSGAHQFNLTFQREPSSPALAT